MLTTNADGTPSYQSKVHVFVHTTYLGNLWVLSYQKRFESCMLYVDYWYTNPQGVIVYDSRTPKGKPFVNVEDEWLHQDFKAWIFHHESRLFIVEVETEKVVVERRVVKGASPKKK